MELDGDAGEQNGPEQGQLDGSDDEMDARDSETQPTDNAQQPFPEQPAPEGPKPELADGEPTCRLAMRVPASCKEPSMAASTW